ncbi:hypothetical protein R3P38DRAFT_3004372 [Favolaschia claudopus]|uniref:Uncharacterized protein n=1 Tax=Favolaschia claudopus TaxID=2862362 RepID=A0AAW0AN84_9AGAR
MSFAFFSLVFATLALPSAASSSPTLSLFLSGPSKVTTVRELHITTTLVNTDDAEVKLLNDPRTVLSTFETDTFTITDPTGKSPSFHGVAVKYVPATVLKTNLPESFTVLAPGASVQIAHDLSKAYNFTSSGEASYDIVANNEFNYVDANGELQTIHASHPSQHTTAISGELAVARRSLDKRISYESCDSVTQTSRALSSRPLLRRRTMLPSLNRTSPRTLRPRPASLPGSAPTPVLTKAPS